MGVRHMALKIRKTDYLPGTYAQKRPGAAQMAQQYIREWEQKRLKARERKSFPAEIVPTICFSRKIGVGALEIADILADKIKFRVADREILETIANDKKLAAKTVAFFDERYPGKMVELTKMLFGEKSFIMSDYLRHIIGAIFAMAETGSTIFVGRGAHLFLPRERVLAVRFICSDEHRIQRLSKIMGVETKKAKKMLKKIDTEQRDFFKKAFGRKDASAYEFDMVINCDYIPKPKMAARIVANAFKQKFGTELKKSRSV
ncbi:MAG: cytidylate kinase-like family protein [Desulfobacterales bacterium]|nr:MAG: cytidylate kinase-like family protein [Desulfobacterales bacterium]